MHERINIINSSKGGFKIGDNVVCPSYGIGEVTAIEKKEIGGQIKPFYVIEIPDGSIKFMIPADGVSSFGIRSIIDEKEIKEIYKVLKGASPSFSNRRGKWVKRCRNYREKLKSGSPYQTAEVLRDLIRLSKKKELSFAERKILETARSLLVKEIALSSSKSENEVQKSIDRIFSRAKSKKS